MTTNDLIFKTVEDKILMIRGEQVILDSDVAKLYGVLTRDINKSVKNNPEKFPSGYIFNLSVTEKNELVENFHRFNSLKHSTSEPTAFTEKGLYMLATILKSKQAIQTTLAIVETFAKIRELSRTVTQLADTKDKKEQKSLMERGGEIFAEILDTGNSESDSETSIEINLAVMKFRHIVRKHKK